MRKVLLFLILTLSVFLLPIMTANASEIIYTNEINDTTSIEADLELLNLDYSDYNLSFNDKSKIYHEYIENGLVEQFVIAVAENREDPNFIISYIYVYNVLFNLSAYTTDIELQVSFNEKNITYKYTPTSSDITLVLEDSPAGIMKFKVSYFKHYDLTRKYSIDINHGPKEAFECVYYTTFNEEQKYRCDSFNFNSFIYITKDEVVSVILKTDQAYDFHSTIGMFCNLVSRKNDWNYTVIYFYNFSSPKKIDKINSANMKWSQHINNIHYEYPFELIVPIVGFFTDATIPFGKLNVVSESQSKNEPKEENIPDEIKEYEYLGSKIQMNAFCTPSSDRLKELGKNADNLSSTEKKKFTDYEHSIMFTAGSWFDSRRNSGSGWMEYLVAEQVSLVSLDFSTNGEHYTAYVSDIDGPDDPVDPTHPIDPSKKPDSWLQKMLLWMGKSIVHFFSPETIWPDWGYKVLGGIISGLVAIVAFAVIVILLIKVLPKLILLPLKIIGKILKL